MSELRFCAGAGEGFREPAVREFHCFGAGVALVLRPSSPEGMHTPQRRSKVRGAPELRRACSSGGVVLLHDDARIDLGAEPLELSPDTVTGGHVSIAGGSIRGSGGVVATGGATVTLRDINFEGLYVDVSDAGTSVTLTNVQIADSPSDGICARRGASVTAMQTDVKGSACFGVSVVDGAEFVAGDGSIVDSGNSGVFVSGRSSITCDGLRVSGNGLVQQHGGVLLQDATGSIEGGSIVDNFGHGVSAQLGSTVTLDAVVVVNNGIHAAGDGSEIDLRNNCQHGGQILEEDGGQIKGTLDARVSEELQEKVWKAAAVENVSQMTALLQLMEAQALSVNFLRDDSTPLMVAAKNGQLGWVKALLDCGADTSETNRAGLTALSVATQRGESDIARAICVMLEEAADLGVDGWMSRHNARDAVLRMEKLISGQTATVGELAAMSATEALGASRIITRLGQEKEEQLNAHEMRLRKKSLDLRHRTEQLRQKDEVPLQVGCDYHFFVSKHEEHKFEALNVADKLRAEGFVLWISQWQQEKGESVDEQEMQKGVRNSAALILLLTHEIFHRDRVWVCTTEVQYAIDIGKPIICIRHHSFEFDSPKCEGLGGHLYETCVNVRPEFQPYARAIISATECLSWSTEPHHQRASIAQIKEKYAQRASAVVKLHEAVETERAFGCCRAVVASISPNPSAVSIASPSASASVSEFLLKHDLMLEMLAVTSAEELEELFADLALPVKLKIQLRKAVKDAAK